METPYSQLCPSQRTDLGYHLKVPGPLLPEVIWRFLPRVPGNICLFAEAIPGLCAIL